MSEGGSGGILIEPTIKVVETVRSAVLDMGLDEFLRRTGASRRIVERWINGEEWVPVSVVKEACEINRKHPDAPSYSKILSECTSGAQLRIAAGGEIKRPEAAIVAPTKAVPTVVPTERPRKPSALPIRREVSNQIIKIAVALFFIPIIGAAIGFRFWGAFGAVVTAITSYVIVAVLIFLSLAVFAKRPYG